MKVTYLLLVLVFISEQLQASLCENMNSNVATPPTTTQYDFIYLVEQWQISICDTRQCLKPARPVFSIRGLWPSYSSGKMPSNCKSHTTFNPNKISDLLTDLNSEWPSLIHEDNSLFWKQEWERHGICSELILNQHAFFKAALELKQKYKLFEMLADQGIYPFGNVYSLDRITNAIKTVTGHRPLVDCNVYKKIPQLSHIFLCFDRTATKIVDCPAIRICHHDELLFPYTLQS